MWCQSPHKLLNYLLMGSEAQVQQEAVCWLNPELKRRKLTGSQILSVHDELTCEFPLEEKEAGISIMSQMYGEASKRLRLEVPITGTAQAGFNWSDIH